MIRLTKTAAKYAADLRGMQIPRDIILKARDVFETVPLVEQELSDPDVALFMKHTVIDKIFPSEIRNFLKILCDNGDMGEIESIFDAYDSLTPRVEEEEVIGAQDIVMKYAGDLVNRQIPQDIVQQARNIFRTVPLVGQELSDPDIAEFMKETVIDKIFPTQIREFLKEMCRKDAIGDISKIFEAYETLREKNQSVLKVTLSYVTPPTDEQYKKIKQFLTEKFPNRPIRIEKKEDKDLVGGFRLTAGSVEYDWSTKGRLSQLQSKLDAVKQHTSSAEGIIDILRAEIEDFGLEAKDKEIGVVVRVGDGIATINGIDHVQYGEIVLFDNGVKGMVQDIRRDEVGCILFDRELDIKEGTRVVRTGKMAGIPVGEKFLSRVINALGAPIDGKGDIREEGYRPIENPAPAIMDRKSVSVPLETGVLAIDSMFPIGRGQRELIIGDRQTGKTSLALDTILNQKGKDVVCIYVAIGQKASTIAQLVNTLRQTGADQYTTVLAATASDPAPLQYIAPYSGTALAEYFMYQGRDVLIVYDDLSKHAVAYRALSLLLERSPAREAYPGDVFYLHSRLLERSSRLSPEKGGGSITALPIIETQAGDVSAYIPTNVISITDGQIFLESNLFFSGQRPAVNVGLSVSRVGGAAQTKAMKKAAGSIRIDLAQYREMEIFTQFSSDLDDATKEQLSYGRGLMELLKQPLGHPLSMEEQVVTLCAATEKIMVDIPTDQIKRFQNGMLQYFHDQHETLLQDIAMEKVLTPNRKEELLAAARAYKNGPWQEQNAEKAAGN